MKVRWLGILLVGCLPNVSFAGVAFNNHVSSPLGVSGEELTYSLNPNLGVVASMSVSGSPSTGAFHQAAASYSTAMPSSVIQSTVSSNMGISPQDPPPPPPIAGDVNLDNVVDILDVIIVQTNFGLEDAIREQGDVSGDGKVTILDLLIVQTNFGNFLTPEPQSMLVFGGGLGLAFAYLYRRRRRGTSKSKQTSE